MRNLKYLQNTSTNLQNADIIKKKRQSLQVFPVSGNANLNNYPIVRKKNSIRNSSVHASAGKEVIPTKIPNLDSGNYSESPEKRASPNPLRGMRGSFTTVHSQTKTPSNNSNFSQFIKTINGPGSFSNKPQQRKSNSQQPKKGNSNIFQKNLQAQAIYQKYTGPILSTKANVLDIQFNNVNGNQRGTGSSRNSQFIISKKNIYNTKQNDKQNSQQQSVTKQNSQQNNQISLQQQQKQQQQIDMGREIQQKRLTPKKYQQQNNENAFKFSNSNRKYTQKNTTNIKQSQLITIVKNNHIEQHILDNSTVIEDDTFLQTSVEQNDDSIVHIQNNNNTNNILGTISVHDMEQKGLNKMNLKLDLTNIKKKIIAQKRKSLTLDTVNTFSRFAVQYMC